MKYFIYTTIGVHFRTWRGGDFLARKIYAIHECVIAEIGIRTHSSCRKNKLVHNLPYGGKFFVGVQFRGFWIFHWFWGKKTRIWISDFKRPSHGKLKFANTCGQTQVGMCERRIFSPTFSPTFSCWQTRI